MWTFKDNQKTQQWWIVENKEIIQEDLCHGQCYEQYYTSIS